MIIVGARGLAKEVLEIYKEKKELDNLFFYDDISSDLPLKLYDKFIILRTSKDAEQILRKDNRFTLGLGIPYLRHRLSQKFENLGGKLVSSISEKAAIGSYGTIIEEGVTILGGVIITNGVIIGKGTLINPHCTISHDVKIGQFGEISPGAKLTGHVEVGDFSTIGTNATLLPKVKIGHNVIVGAGAVVTKDVPDNTLVFGVPAKVIKEIHPPFSSL